MTKLTLSFDNGPQPGATEWILDELAARSLRASFFVVGQTLADPACRALADRARAEGHWIGNHTLTHTVPLGLRPGPDVPEQEIGGAARILGTLAGDEKLFRPNGKGTLGHHLLSPAAVAYLVAHDYTVVTWNCVPRDYEPPRGAWLPRALADIPTRDWTLLVLHDQHLDRQPLAAFLDRMHDDAVEIVQEFPPACIPIRRGVAQPGLQDIVMQAAT